MCIDMTLNLNKVCRLCMLEEEKLLPIFNGDVNLPQRITDLVPVLKLFIGDGLPMQVCSQCVRQVNISYNFKLRCERTDAMLKQLLSQQIQTKSQKDQFCEMISVKTEVEVTEHIVHNENLRIDGSNDQGLSEPDLHIDLQLCDTDLTKEYCNANELHNYNELNILEVKDSRGKCVQPKMFVCHVCGKPFQFKKDLHRHMVTHTGERAFICDVCGKKFSLKDNLKIHSRVHTGEKPYSCEDCGACFRQQNGLTSHMKTHTGEKPYSCVDCGKRFALSTHLQVHLVCHTGEKAFSCTVCLKSFGRKDGLKQHMQIHTGQKPFLCTICGKSFAQKSQLNTHSVAHTHIKPHLCPECGKTFVNSTRLRDHLTSHTGQRPFACEQCNKGFVRREHLRYHLKAVHGRRAIKF